MENENNMDTINTITVTWKSKRIAKQNLTLMKSLLNGRLHTLVKNTADKVRVDTETKAGLVDFHPAGPESTKMILELLRITGGKVTLA